MCDLTGSFMFIIIVTFSLVAGFDFNSNNHIVDLASSEVECEKCSKNPDEDLTAVRFFFVMS